MSGHSKWAKIKRAKGANDVKKGQIYTKLSNQITIATREGGSDPSMNFMLRMQIDKAREENMPSSSIERAIEKGVGGAKGVSNIARVTYEGIGPSGVAILVDCITDNTNRTVSEIRNIFENSGGTLESANSLLWKFKEIGLITIRSATIKKSEKFGKDFDIEDLNPEELELELIEVEGIDDIDVLDVLDGEETCSGLEVFTHRENLDKVRKEIEGRNIKIISAELIKVADQKISLEKSQMEKLESLLENLEDYDDVENVWTNCDS